MKATQIVVLVLLAALVVGVFIALAYLLIFNHQPATTAPAAAPATAAAAPQSTRAPSVTATPRTPTATRTRRVAATAVSPQKVKTVAQATEQAVNKATAEAQQKIEVALRRLPAGAIELPAENAHMGLTITRMGWLGPGSLWLRLKWVNRGQEKLTVEPARLLLEDSAGGLNVPDPAGNSLPGALPKTELEPGGGVEGQVSFKLPLDTVPAALGYDDPAGSSLKVDILGWILTQPAPTATRAQ